MDVLLLSRLQFAVATFFHFLFVPLTLGLSILVAIMETIYVRTGNEQYRRMAKFWGKLFLINFSLGVVTGITLEFQFGTNWSRYSEYVGDIFGSLLAIEATVAFFLESSFIAVWFFGWKKLSPRLHAACIWLVAIGSNISAYWILAANAWMQHPVGYTIRNGRAELTSLWAIISSPFAILEFFHTVIGAYVLSGFFVLGVSAWHLLKQQEMDFFRKSFRLALGFTLLFSFLEIFTGHLSGSEVAQVQPLKLAAMESLWESRENAPIYMIQIPDPENERNALELLPIPGMLSILANHSPNTLVKGIKEFPKEEWPPVNLMFYSFRIMVGLGFFFAFLSAVGWLLRNKLEKNPWLLKTLIYTIPLPYLALELGWTVAEVGRQPWIVYGLMKTSDAVSPVAPSQVMTSLVAFIIIYSILGAVDFYLLAKYARKGPKPIPAAGPRRTT